jgi:stage V sporulation protein SpoVS
MSIFTDALDDIYDSDIGVDATLSILTESVRVIDKTAGVELQPSGKVSVPTLVPAVAIQRSTLTEAGVTNLATLINTTITLNGATWKIINHRPAPQPGGERDGEVYLILREQ